LTNLSCLHVIHIVKAWYNQVIIKKARDLYFVMEMFSFSFFF